VINRSPAYQIAADLPYALAIVDRYSDGTLCPTVTNGAEIVVNDLQALFLLDGVKRLIYCDTEGWWDEIVYDRNGFVAFAPIRVRTLDEALAACRWRSE
jgi:hypothetical protein